MLMVRVFISRTLATFLPQITPCEAVEYVLPLLNGLGTDQGGFSIFFSGRLNRIDRSLLAF